MMVADTFSDCPTWITDTMKHDLVKNVNKAQEKEYVNDSINVTYSTLTGKVTFHVKNKCKLALFRKLSHLRCGEKMK
jgi:hypothetical protein